MHFFMSGLTEGLERLMPWLRRESVFSVRSPSLRYAYLRVSRSLPAYIRIRRGFGPTRQSRCLPPRGHGQSLAEAGYRTNLFGKTHFHESAHPSGDLRDGMDLMRGYGLMDVDEISGPHASVAVQCAMTDSWRVAGLLDAFRQRRQAKICGNAVDRATFAVGLGPLL